MCPTHSEAKQAETSEFGAERVLLQGQARRTGSSCSKDLNSPVDFKEEGFIGNVCEEGCRVCTLLWLVDGEVTGWCSRNLDHRPSGSYQSGVHMLVLSLMLPSSPWVGGLLSCRRTQRYVSDNYVHPLRRNQDQSPSLRHCLFLHSLAPLNTNCLNLPFGTQRRSRRLKTFSINRNEGHLCLRGPYRVPHVFRIIKWREFPLWLSRNETN